MPDVVVNNVVLSRSVLFLVSSATSNALLFVVKRTCQLASSSNAIAKMNGGSGPRDPGDVSIDPEAPPYSGTHGRMVLLESAASASVFSSGEQRGTDAVVFFGGVDVALTMRSS